jgi:hypothetical protein
MHVAHVAARAVGQFPINPTQRKRALTPEPPNKSSPRIPSGLPAIHPERCLSIPTNAVYGPRWPHAEYNLSQPKTDRQAYKLLHLSVNGLQNDECPNRGWRLSGGTAVLVGNAGLRTRESLCADLDGLECGSRAPALQSYSTSVILSLASAELRACAILPAKCRRGWNTHFSPSTK